MDPQQVVGQIRMLLFFEAKKCSVMRDCCCKYKLPEISRLLRYADMRTVKLSGTFHLFTQLLSNSIKTILL